MRDPAPVQPPALRIASYNIRKAKGLDRRYDPARVIRVINGFGADLVALQEADFRMGDRPAALPKDMLARETDFELLSIAGNERSLGWHGNAVLLRKGLNADTTERITLPGLEPRGAVFVKLCNGIGIIATHLGLRRRDRARQLRLLRDAVTGPTAIVGDFNEWSRKRGFEALGTHYTTFAPGASFHSRHPIASLDRIALSQDLRLQAAGVHRCDLSRRASDHLPIWADIAFAQDYLENMTGRSASFSNSYVAAPMTKS